MKSSPSKVWRRTSDCIPLQEAFWKNDAVECGYCTPGMLMSAYGLLSKGKQSDDEQIKKAISGNLCRCTGYGNIVAAVEARRETLPNDGSHVASIAKCIGRHKRHRDQRSVRRLPSGPTSNFER